MVLSDGPASANADIGTLWPSDDQSPNEIEVGSDNSPYRLSHRGASALAHVQAQAALDLKSATTAPSAGESPISD